jgi:hypothetical protein
MPVLPLVLPLVPPLVPPLVQLLLRQNPQRLLRRHPSRNRFDS